MKKTGWREVADLRATTKALTSQQDRLMLKAVLGSPLLEASLNCSSSWSTSCCAVESRSSSVDPAPLEAFSRLHEGQCVQES